MSPQIQSTRPLLVGPDVPNEPFPIYAKGSVIPGFQRGSKQLGIPTANLPGDVATSIADQVQKGSGIYYGWAGLKNQIYPMVMSVGWNPFYKNEKRTAEIHLIHQFEEDFYDEELRIVVLDYIRDEKSYDSVDALIQDIKTDIAVAENGLNRPAYLKYKEHSYLQSAS